MSDRQYYYVYNPKGLFSPTVRHETWTDAFSEAKRLHAKQPSDTFEIFMYIGCVRPKLDPELVIAESEG
jgi:hypothetical protein